MSAGLVATGLVRIYRGRRVVDGVDLQVEPGEIVGLLGPNGAGKTTCFRMITGLERPDLGQVQLDDQDLGRLPLWRRVRLGLGYLPQESSVFRKLSARQNLAVALEGQPDGPSAEELLAEAGLSQVADSPAGTLSGGERRRLEIARCLALRPRVVLLDEPFAGVDPVAVADLQVRIRALARQGIGVLLTDHAVREALLICDRALLLDAGRVLVSGSPSEVATDAFARARYLGHDFVLEASRPTR